MELITEEFLSDTRTPHDQLRDAIDTVLYETAGFRAVYKHDGAHIYHQHDVVTRARVSLGRVYKGGEYAAVYTIYSPTNLTATGRAKSTTKRNIALREIRKSITAPPNHLTIHKAIRMDADNIMTNATREVRNILHDAAHKLAATYDYASLRDSAMLRELRRAISFGYTCSDPSIREALDKFDKHEASITIGMDIDLVTISGPNDAPTYNIAHIPPNQYSNVGHNVQDDMLTYAADVPEDIVGKIASLQIVEPRTFVAGLGIRMSDRVYYIAR